MPITAGNVMDSAAALLNDPNKITYTYAKMLPYLKLAYQEVQDRLVSLGHSIINSSTTVPVTAGSGSVTMIGPTQARDVLLQTVRVAQRKAGENDDAWVPVDPLNWLEPHTPKSELTGWVWQNGIIQFNPATEDLELRIDMRARLAVIVDENTDLLHPGFQTFLSQKTAGYIAEFVMKDRSRAAALYALTKDTFDTAIQTAVKSMQWFPAKRRPYFFGR